MRLWASSRLGRETGPTCIVGDFAEIHPRILMEEPKSERHRTPHWISRRGMCRSLSTAPTHCPENGSTTGTINAITGESCTLTVSTARSAGISNGDARSVDGWSGTASRMAVIQTALRGDAAWRRDYNTSRCSTISIPQGARAGAQCSITTDGSLPCIMPAWECV